MGELLNHLEQVKKDAERITLKRIQDAKEEKAYQESKVGEHVSLDEKPVEVVAEAVVEKLPAKAESKKGKK